MMTTPTEERLKIVTVEREVLARTADDRPAMWHWNVVALGADGMEFRFRLGPTEVPEPDGEVLIHWRAQVVRP